MEGQGWEKPWRFVLLDTAGGRYLFLFAYALLILAFDESPKFLTRDPQTDMTVLWRQYTRPRAVRGFVEIRCGLACARDGRSGRQPAFSHGYHPEHTERLAAYWAEAFGGPPRYTEQYGDESSVVRMHSGNGLHEDMDRRAIACFDQALRQCGARRACDAPAGIARRLCVQHADDDGSLSWVRHGCARWAPYPALVVGGAPQPITRQQWVLVNRHHRHETSSGSVPRC